MAESSDKELAKGELHETVERLAASFDPSAEQGAFVRVEQESRQIGSFSLVHDRTFYLCFGDGRLDVFGPQPIKLPKTFADRVSL